MRVTDVLEKSDKTLFSFELLPPRKGNGIKALYDHIDPLMEFNPQFINVTYHREEYVYKKRSNGYLEKVSIRKRPGTVGICAAIKNRYDVITVPHLTCGGFSKQETEEALIDLDYLGITDVLALRGDPEKTERTFVPDPNGHSYAVELVEQIMAMNNGRYLEEDVESSHKTNFSIGVAGYPEKHAESMSLTTDLEYLKKKIDAGAEYIVTQMFFDNEKFFHFVDQCRAIGIDVPIIPGLKPITTLNHIKFLPKTFAIDFPDDLARELVQCKTREAVRQVGIEWSIAQSKELIKFGVPSLHFYTMGRSDITRRIAEQIY
jgi:methylenetetrahydrofolate reductase (NADPH)